MMMDKRMKWKVDEKIDELKYMKYTEFDPVHDYADFLALDKYCTNHECKVPSYGREIWEAIHSVYNSYEKALEYWNRCWFHTDRENTYRFSFPSINCWDEYKEENIPEPTEENFVNFEWEL